MRWVVTGIETVTDAFNELADVPKSMRDVAFSLVVKEMRAVEVADEDWRFKMVGVVVSEGGGDPCIDTT